MPYTVHGSGQAESSATKVTGNVRRTLGLSSSKSHIERTLSDITRLDRREEREWFEVDQLV
jgi:hypothetical protein